MAKKILKFDPEDSFDFILIAIICSYKDYRLCFELNKELNISLEKQNDYELLTQKNGSAHYFSFFRFTDEEEKQFYVLANKGNRGHLIPEKSSLDYFLLIKNTGSDFDVGGFLKLLRTIEIIDGATEMDPSRLKSAHNLILD